MILSNYHRAYLIGIGGIGMSAIARYLMRQGWDVAGYDRVETPLTGELVNEGMDIHYEDKAQNIPSRFLNKDQSLIIYTPAIPATNRELNFLKDNGYKVVKRSEVLAAITNEHPAIAVAGTHGKTTTSSIISHMLYKAGVPFYGLVGGLLAEYNSNFLHIPGENPIFVVEADEYDRSFLRLNPNIAVITALDADHLDIYQTKEEFKKAFIEFAGLTTDKVVLNHRVTEHIKPVNSVTYGTGNAQIRAENIRIINNQFIFDYIDENGYLPDLATTLPGAYNVENATAAIAVCRSYNIPDDAIREALGTFQGIKRRFEIINQLPFVFIDDYAHHPDEISAFLKGVRMLYPDKEITVIFQPHLYSRTRDFAEGFGHSLGESDKVILLEIYPAREVPIPGITSEIILDYIPHQNKSITTRERILEESESWSCPEVICTIGAGNIDAIVQPLADKLIKKFGHEA